MLKLVPIIERLREELLSGLAKEELDVGDRVPSEGKLAERFGVSRNTVREVMIRLESEGMVARCHGIGTILRRSPSSHVRSVPIPEGIRRQGKVPGVERISVTEDTVSSEIAERFRLPPDANFLRLERVMTADGEPVAFVVDHLSQARVASWEFDWSSFDGNFIRLLSMNTGSERFLQNASVSATLADETTANMLQCEIGAPLVEVSTDMFSEKVELLAVTRLLFVPGAVPVEFAGTIYATTAP